MNKVYRTVFNEKTNTWVAVAETAKAHGKSGRSGGVVAAVADGMLLNKKMLTVSAAVAVAMAAQPAMAAEATHYYSVNSSEQAAGSNYNNDGATGTDALAAGVNAKATGVGTLAAGVNAKATGEYSTAVGYEASAGHQLGVAIGYYAETRGDYSLALGALAKAGTSTEVDSWGTAVGYSADAGGSGSPLAIGTYSKTTSGESPIAIGDWATGEGDGAVAIGSKRYGQHLPGKATYAKGNQTVALGSLAQATQEKALALGANANASLANAVALGAGSLTNQDATQETQATVGGITYGAAAGQPAAFAGAANVQAGSQVSMGAAGSERQIKHVAPGAISADSTDAINGSQLHATQAVIGNLASTTASHLGGTVSVGADGKLTAPAYNVAGNTYNNVGAALGALDGAITNNKTHYYSVNSSEQAAGSNYNNDGATGTNALAAGVKAQAAQRNSIAIGNEAEVENSPANPSSSSIAIGDKAKAQGDLALAIGPGATVSGESAAGGIAIGSAATSKNGGMAVGSGANAGNGTPMIPGLPVRLNNNVALGDSALVKDDTNFRVALGSFSIAGESDLTAAPYKPTANANVAGIAGSGVELGEVSVGGDNTAGMGKTLYRRVTNVAAGAADTDAVNVSQLKAAQAAAASKVAAGNGISVTPNVDATTGSTTYTVAADTTTLNVGDGNNGNPAGKVIAADANKLATAGDIANAINNSGFNINAGGNVVGTSTATTAKPGSTLTLKAGDGLTVKQELDPNGNQSYTYALDAQTVVQNAQTSVVYTDANGNKVYKHTDGNFYTQPNGGGTQVAASNVIASMQNAAGSTTAPTTLANVKGNLADTSNATGNPSGNDRATLAAGNKGNNAATVNDVLNAGFTVQGNGTDKDFVTHGDTINFANGQGTVANVSTAGGVTTVKFDTPMTYVDNAGAPTNTPSNKVNLVGDATTGGPVTLGNVASGTLSATSTEAVNGSQLYATNQNVATGINFGGTTGSNNYQLGATINVKGDNNITSTTVNGGVQLGLNRDLNVTSVTATDAAGNQTVTNGGGVTITPAAGGGNPVSLTTGGLNNGGNKITNIAPGEISATSTDAVNGSQLHNAINNSVGNVAGAVENLQNRMGKLQDDSEAGTASALAAAGLPQAYLPGKSMIAVSGSTYRGQQGYAVGMSAISDSGNWIVKGTATGNSRGHFGATIGAGYQW